MIVLNIKTLSFLKVCKRLFTLPALQTFALFLFFITPCSSPPSTSSKFQISPEDQKWLEKFFHDFVVHEEAAYTLWGSKPLSEIIVYDYTKEELEQINKTHPLVDLDNCVEYSQQDFLENFKKWEQISSNFPIKKYLFFKARENKEEHYFAIYFVDIFKTAQVIENHYSLFKEEVGFDFNPLEVVLEMPNSSSIFWEKTHSSPKSALLWGILFGYGKENATGFYWHYFCDSEACENYLTTYPRYSSNPDHKGIITLKLKNMHLPPFVSFTENDPVIEKFKKEREKIQKIYKKGKFLEITLNKLTEGRG